MEILTKDKEFLIKNIEIMVAKKFIPNRDKNHHSVLLLEKHFLEKSYTFLKVNISNGMLICSGACKPTEYSASYQYKIRYIPGSHPKVFVTNPTIQYNDDIHMYSDDNSLCLYYPKDYSWNKTSHLFNTIVPWTHEWFIFYELYLISGKWNHPYVSHKKI